MRETLKNSKRIVVKVGTSTLIHADTGLINLDAIDQLSFVLSALRNNGREIILVSSGAIGVGMNKLKLKERPISIPERQAVAAVGQAELMTIYNQRFVTYVQDVAQILLTRDVVDYPDSRKNVINTIEELIKMSIIPIINENDSVAVDELEHQTKIGDNDQLSAIVAELTNSDLLIMLSDIDGLYSSNPRKDNNAKLYEEINFIDHTILDLADGAGSDLGTGGMVSKIKAAEKIFSLNKKMVLANGSNPKIIFDILNGERIGTYFCLYGGKYDKS